MNKLRVLLFNYLTNGDLFICSTTQDGVQCRFFWKAAGIFLNIETGTDLMDGIHGISSIQNGKLFGKTNGSCMLPEQFAAVMMKCRSEERRVGKEGGARWSRCHYKRAKVKNAD